MQVGLQQIFASYGWDNITDSEVYEEEKKLSLFAETLNFDCIWPVEHHFSDYSFCPDNIEYLAWVAGATQRIDIGTAAVILPWNDPLRVVEKLAMLDNLSNGRVRFGMGRGLSRLEFEPFHGVELEQTRERFNEASVMIVNALESGFIEGEGKYYPQKRTEIRPRLERSFKERTYAVANSEDSLEAAAVAGAGLIMFAEKDWTKRLSGIEFHRKRFKEIHNRVAPPILIGDFTFCHPDEAYAKEVGERALTQYLSSILEHYELMSDHLNNTKGYTQYGKQASFLQKVGFETYVQGFLPTTAYGTPQQIIDRCKERREILGDFELATCFRFGGLPFEQVEASMRLYAAEVLPELQSWQ
jgi:alkanesulfonate monooxygenase SsuD/methylene tetrahydromethanopterin reductase-like flavin-dependent oxidoreductase (luciferase family)